MIFQVILAILKAIPALRKSWEDLIYAYNEHKIAEMKKENKEAIGKAINENDQRDIEKLLQSPRAGELSGLPGTSVVDAVPGIVQSDSHKG